MSKVLTYLPELEGDEQVYVARLLKEMNDDQAQQFAHIYRSRRRDHTNILLMAVLGFVLVAGVHRFYLDQIGMGLLYLFTGGFCAIGTIIDIVRYKSLTYAYNEKKAREAATTVLGAIPGKARDAGTA